LASRLSAAPAADAAFAVDLLTMQTREIWDLRLALRRSEAAALTAQTGAHLPRQLQGETEMLMVAKADNERLRLSVLEAREGEHREYELCEELAHEARGMTVAAEHMERRDQAQRRMLQRASERIQQAEGQVERLESEFHDLRVSEASAIFALKVEAREAAAENQELALKLRAGTSGLNEPWSTSNKIPWGNPGKVFDMFACDTGGGKFRLRAAELGHICELLRRHQGRPATAAADRRGFSEFAFVAVFGTRSAAGADRATFVELFKHMERNLEELEFTFESQRSASEAWRASPR